MLHNWHLFHGVELAAIYISYADLCTCLLASLALQKAE